MLAGNAERLPTGRTQQGGAVTTRGRQSRPCHAEQWPTLQLACGPGGRHPQGSNLFPCRLPSARRAATLMFPAPPSTSDTLPGGAIRSRVRQTGRVYQVPGGRGCPRQPAARGQAARGQCRPAVHASWHCCPAPASLRSHPACLLQVRPSPWPARASRLTLCGSPSAWLGRSSVSARMPARACTGRRAQALHSAPEASMRGACPGNYSVIMVAHGTVLPGFLPWPHMQPGTSLS